MKYFLGVLLAVGFAWQQTAEAASTKYELHCTLVKNGDVSPLDDALSTMEDYNKIRVVARLSNRGTTLIEGKLGGFWLDPKVGDRVSTTLSGTTERTVIQREHWEQAQFAVVLKKKSPVRGRNNQYFWGTVFYRDKPGRPEQNAGTLICKSAVTAVAR